MTLRHTVSDLDWVPKVAAGWHICLAVAARLLDGDPAAPIVGEKARNHGWDDLHDAYAEELGVAGTASESSRAWLAGWLTRRGCRGPPTYEEVRV